MKYFVFALIMSVVSIPAFSLSAGRGGRSMTNQMSDQAATERTTVSKNQIALMSTLKRTKNGGVATVTSGTTQSQETEDNSRKEERAACLNNNVGLANTFVWASRYGNTTDYISMVEDTENPDNNACFVRIDVKSADSGVDVSDIPARYYEMGSTIECGSWADEEVLKKRILDAKKSARGWATAGAVVGGVAIGVGAMEAFGNKAIGGKIEGQKAKNLSDTEIQISKLMTLKNKGDSSFNTIKTDLENLKTLCDATKDDDGKYVASACYNIDFEAILKEINK